MLPMIVLQIFHLYTALFSRITDPQLFFFLTQAEKYTLSWHCNEKIWELFTFKALVTKNILQYSLLYCLAHVLL